VFVEINSGYKPLLVVEQGRPARSVCLQAAGEAERSWKGFLLQLGLSVAFTLSKDKGRRYPAARAGDGLSVDELIHSICEYSGPGRHAGHAQRIQARW
jgi:hypothetical protein